MVFEYYLGEKESVDKFGLLVITNDLKHTNYLLKSLVCAKMTLMI